MMLTAHLDPGFRGGCSDGKSGGSGKGKDDNVPWSVGCLKPGQDNYAKECYCVGVNCNDGTKVSGTAHVVVHLQLACLVAVACATALIR